MNLHCSTNNLFSCNFLDKIWQKILVLGSEDSSRSDLAISPTIHGERHSPTLKGTISNVEPDNISLGHVARALCKGVIANIHE